MSSTRADTNPRLIAALHYAALGWPVLPLHTPDEFGACDCPKRTNCESPGKHPRTKNGLDDASLDEARVRRWWGIWPEANLAIDLARAALVDIAPDSIDWFAEFIARGLPQTLHFASGGGEGHAHYLYARPAGCAVHRDCHTGQYDVLSAGYAVVPPSLHASGRTYTWLEPADGVVLMSPTVPAPSWAVDMLTHAKSSPTAPPAPQDAEAPPVELRGEALERWYGRLFEPKPNGDVDRSYSLWWLAIVLLEAGCRPVFTEQLLAERDSTLGWTKFTGRRDASVRYRIIVARAVAGQGPGHAGSAHLNGSVASTTVPSTPSVPVDAPWPEPLEDVAFYGPLGEFVLAASRQSEADPAAILAMTMSAVSAALNPRTGGYAANAWHPIRISSVIVGPTAKGRKGSASKIAEAVARHADPIFGEHIVEGLSSGEGVIWAIHDAIQKWDLKKQVWVTEDPGVDDKRVLVVESEFANALRVLQREGNTLSAILRRAWDLPPRGVLRMLTKNSPARATGAHVVIAGHVTRDELLRYVDQTELVNGFANRFLWFAARRHQELPFGEEVDPIMIGNFASVVAQAATWSEAGHRMGWASETRDAWQAAYHSLGSGGAGMHAAVTARAEPQVMRISQLFAALDRTNHVSRAHLAAAMAVWAYVDRTCHWIFGDIVGDQHADDILFSLRSDGPMTRTEISKCLGRNVNSADIGRALTLLRRAGLVDVSTVSTGGRGRPAETWRAV